MTTSSPAEPSLAPPRKAFIFVDGQNLFHEAQRAFAYDYPNYDIHALAQAVCAPRNWHPSEIRFYTGIPGPGDDPPWNTFWQRKLRAMSQRGIKTFSRQLRYRTETIDLPDGTTHTYRYPQEKGIDVRIAIDALRGAYRQEYEVAVFFSLDQDLSEVAMDIRTLAQEQGRIVDVASAYPCAPERGTPKPIGHTIGIHMDRAMYDACLDRRDYRPIQRFR